MKCRGCTALFFLLALGLALRVLAEAGQDLSSPEEQGRDMLSINDALVGLLVTGGGGYGLDTTTTNGDNGYLSN